MSTKPKTVNTTYCDAPNCKHEVVVGGQRQVDAPAGFTVTIYKKNKKGSFALEVLKPGTNYYSLGCMINAIKKSVDEAQREDPKLPYPDDGKP